MRKGEETRARILEEAARQASLRGLATVSLNDVAEAIGISKSGVFKHFQAKEAMQQAVLEATIERVMAYVWIPMLAMPKGGPARLRRLLEKSMDWDEFECGAFGCLVQSATVEFDDQPGPIRDLLHAAQGRAQIATENEFRYLCDPPLDAATIGQAAYEFRTLIHGFIAMRRTLPKGEARARTLAGFEQLLQRLRTKTAA